MVSGRITSMEQFLTKVFKKSFAEIDSPSKVSLREEVHWKNIPRAEEIFLKIWLKEECISEKICICMTIIRGKVLSRDKV